MTKTQETKDKLLALKRKRNKTNKNPNHQESFPSTNPKILSKCQSNKKRIASLFIHVPFVPCSSIVSSLFYSGILACTDCHNNMCRFCVRSY